MRNHSPFQPVEILPIIIAGEKSPAINSKERLIVKKHISIVVVRIVFGFTHG